MKRPSTDFIVVIGLIIAAVVALQLFSLTSSQSDIIQTQQQAAIKDITSAIKGYQFEYNAEPPVDNIQFFKTLLGENATNITFLDLRDCRPRRQPKGGILYDEDGNFVQAYDMWGTPYRITLDSNGWRARSAGKNRTFNDSDDLTATVPAIANHPAKPKQRSAD